jgi:hypothetical protein
MLIANNSSMRLETEALQRLLSSKFTSRLSNGESFPLASH